MSRYIHTQRRPITGYVWKEFLPWTEVCSAESVKRHISCLYNYKIIFTFVTTRYGRQVHSPTKKIIASLGTQLCVYIIIMNHLDFTMERFNYFVWKCKLFSFLALNTYDFTYATTHTIYISVLISISLYISNKKTYRPMSLLSFCKSKNRTKNIIHLFPIGTEYIGTTQQATWTILQWLHTSINRPIRLFHSLHSHSLPVKINCLMYILHAQQGFILRWHNVPE